MSIIATYARINENHLDSLRIETDWMGALFEGRVSGAAVIDLDKSGNGIFWLLSALPTTEFTSVARRDFPSYLSGGGGTPDNCLEAGYGPASILDASQIKELSDWLNNVDKDQLRRLYDPQAMSNDEVYPQIWVKEGISAFDEYLSPYFDLLRKFFSEAAASEQCVLVFFT